MHSAIGAHVGPDGRSVIEASRRWQGVNANQTLTLTAQTLRLGKRVEILPRASLRPLGVVVARLQSDKMTAHANTLVASYPASTHKRTGYRTAGTIERTVTARILTSEFWLTLGEPVPHRRELVLVRQLSPFGQLEVRIAAHAQQRHVFKFNRDGLKREVPVSQLPGSA